MERTGFKIGNDDIVLLGTELKVGDKAKDFTLTGLEMQDVKLSDYDDKIKLIFSVPSFDTPICQLEIVRFNKEAEKLGDELVLMAVSADLPFAQSRFCQAKEISNLVVASDHKEMDFGNKFGTHMKDLRLENRSVFVLSKDNTVTYVEYVIQNADHPDYDKALDAARELLK
ncbi:MAG: thiol peroxidase [Coriobacteriia bacterium]|nr:thiol peroxidase [Coriobacteriia bacterium]